MRLPSIMTEIRDTTVKGSVGLLAVAESVANLRWGDVRNGITWTLATLIAAAVLYSTLLDIRRKSRDLRDRRSNDQEQP